MRDDFEIRSLGNFYEGLSAVHESRKIVAFNSPVMQFTMYAVVLIMVYLGGKSIIFGSMADGRID